MAEEIHEPIGPVMAIGYPQSETAGRQQNDYDLICFGRKKTSLFLGFIRLHEPQGWEEKLRAEEIMKEYPDLCTRIRINGGVEKLHIKFLQALADFYRVLGGNLTFKGSYLGGRAL